MESEADKKFTWVIKNFSSLQSEFISSETFLIGGCKWRLMASFKGKQIANYFSPYLMVADFKTLAFGWKRHIKYRLTIVNQLSDKLSQLREQERWFDIKTPLYGCFKMISLPEINNKKGGFVVNDEVKIVVEIDVLEVIGKLDVSEVTQPLKRTKLNHDGAVSVSSSVVVNGFLVLPSQVESVKRIFEKHPDMALEFRAKNQHLRTSCINVLLNLIETLCQSLQDLSVDDLSQEVKTLTYLKDSGFKVDWLERKLEEVKKMKNEEQIGQTRMKQLEEELKVFKKKCSDIEGMLEKEKAKVLAATRAPPLTLEDVV